uniref:Uncharacterized protein n=2 Tax=Passerellidae TaxID=1729112 RepID=A0A8D2QG03_ZONAL
MRANLIILKLQLFSQCSFVTFLLGACSPWYSVNVPTLCLLVHSAVLALLPFVQADSMLCSLCTFILFWCHSVSLSSSMLQTIHVYVTLCFLKEELSETDFHIPTAINKSTNAAINHLI